jgi:hypothetical protein
LLKKETMMRKTLLGLAALTAAFAVDAAPASAQGYRLYPWCAQYSGRGGSNCYFSTYSQCREAVSGVGGVCVQNTFYSAYGSYYSFGGSGPARGSRRGVGWN